MEYEVILQRVGSENIMTIKEVREITEVGLKDAKDMVDNVPQVIMKNLSLEEAQMIKSRLEVLGNIVTIKEMASSMEQSYTSMTSTSTVCPKCRGFNIFPAAPGLWGKLMQKITKTNFTYKCDDCGYKW